MSGFIFSEEVVQVMRAFERVSKTIWELKNKLNAHYDQELFYVEFDDNKKENVLVLETENLTVFFYYAKPQPGEHMKLTNLRWVFLK